MSRRHSLLHRINRFWKVLGPGLITGASDDDPSAITTYSQAGARFGLSTLWIAVLAFPILSVLQETCARIGIVTGKGLTGVVRSYYPKWVLWALIIISCPAFLCNMGADIAILGEIGHLLFPHLQPVYCSIAFTLFLFSLMMLLPYRKLAALMKFICFILLVYVIVPFLVVQDAGSIIRHSLMPSFEYNRGFLLTVIGLTGAVISPYIFFWQTSSEVETLSTDRSQRQTPGQRSMLTMRKDILAGAFFAVLVMYYIILTTGTILHREHIYNINSIKDAAIALRPLAGNLSFILFSIGIIATGFLIIPVLSASISYILTDAFDHKSGFNESRRDGKWFYIIIGVAMSFGICMQWVGLQPVKALFLTTILYGFVTPFLIIIILHIANNKKIMGTFRNSWASNVISLIALFLMLGAVIAATVILL